MEKIRIRLQVNGEEREALAPVHHTLLEVLREDLGLMGTKHGCELGECGTCTVLMDGAARAVLPHAARRVRRAATSTVEGMAEGGALHPLQQAFAGAGRRAVRLLHAGLPAHRRGAAGGGARGPTRQEIAEATAGNLCRCTGYLKIFEAIELAAARMRGETAPDAHALAKAAEVVRG